MKPAIGGARAPRPADSRPRGFTLIELLVVLTIIGVIVSLATIAFRDNRGDILEREARRLAAVIQLAGEEATVKARTIGVRVLDNEYAFYLYDAKTKQWNRIEDDRELRPHTLPEPLEMQMVMAGAKAGAAKPKPAAGPAKDEKEGEKPHFVLYSSGELSPGFEIDVRHPELKGAYRITGREDGTLEFHAETE